jgi:uncharacterized membrane protein YraQ (UPF0718 family)
MDSIAMYVAAGVLLAASFLKDRAKTKQALKKGLMAIEGIMPQFLAVLFVIAVSLSVFDPAFISRVLGAETGVAGMGAASLVGAVTLMPGFVAFPIASELLKGGAGVLQIAAFVSSLMMVGVVTLPMEASLFGRKAAILRNGFAFAFSIGAAFFIAWAYAL